MSIAQSPETVICKRGLLKGATAFIASVLPDCSHLIAGVVGGDRGRGDAASLPVKHFSFDSAAENIRVDLLLTFLYPTVYNRSFIRQRHNFATSTTAAVVARLFCRSILIRCNEWPAFPVICLFRVFPTKTSTSRRIV